MANLYSGVAYGGGVLGGFGRMVSSSALAGVSNVSGSGTSSVPLSSSGCSSSSPVSISRNGGINLVDSAAPVLLQQQQQSQKALYADPIFDHRFPPAATVPRLDFGFGAASHQSVPDQQLAQRQLQHLQQQPQESRQSQQRVGFLAQQQALPHPLPQLVGAPVLQQAHQQAGSSDNMFPSFGQSFGVSVDSELEALVASGRQELLANDSLPVGGETLGTPQSASSVGIPANPFAMCSATHGVTCVTADDEVQQLVGILFCCGSSGTEHVFRFLSWRVRVWLCDCLV